MIEQSRDLKNSSTGIINTSITVHYCNFKLEPCTLNKCRVDAKGNGVSFKHIKGGILSKEHLDQRSGKKYHDYSVILADMVLTCCSNPSRLCCGHWIPCVLLGWKGHHPTDQSKRICSSKGNHHADSIKFSFYITFKLTN